jgi:hypothetical protein
VGHFAGDKERQDDTGFEKARPEERLTHDHRRRDVIADVMSSTV